MSTILKTICFTPQQTFCILTIQILFLTMPFVFLTTRNLLLNDRFVFLNMFFAFLNMIGLLLSVSIHSFMSVLHFFAAIGGFLMLLLPSLEARGYFLVHLPEQNISSNIENFIKLTTIMNDILEKNVG